MQMLNGTLEQSVTNFTKVYIRLMLANNVLAIEN